MLLHLVVLGAVVSVPLPPVMEDEASLPDAVTLVMAPLAAQPDETSPAQASPVLEALPPVEPSGIALVPPPPAEPSPSPELIPSPDNIEPLPLPPPPEPAPSHPATRVPVARPAPARRVAGQPAPAEPSKAAAQAVGADLLGPYRNSLAAHMKAYQRYPALARARREEGLVVVRVTIKRDGEVVAASIEHASGWETLDREALATLKRADPLPPVPAGVAGATMELVFPVRFHIE